MTTPSSPSLSSRTAFALWLDVLLRLLFLLIASPRITGVGVYVARRWLKVRL